MRDTTTEIQETHEIAKAVAKETTGFHYDPNAQGTQDGELYRCASLRNAQGAEVFIHAVWNKPERLMISGTIPARNGYAYGQKRPNPITVAKARGAAAIAREIERRLLPEYLPLYEAACQERERHEKAAVEGKDSTQRLADLCGESLREQGHTDSWAFSLYSNDEQGRFTSGEVTRNIFSNVAIKLNGLTEEMATRILKLVLEAEK